MQQFKGLHVLEVLVARNQWKPVLLRDGCNPDVIFRNRAARFGEFISDTGVVERGFLVNGYNGQRSQERRQLLLMTVKAPGSERPISQFADSDCRNKAPLRTLKKLTDKSVTAKMINGYAGIEQDTII